MTSMQKVSIALDIQLQAPLHITSLEDGRYVASEPKHRQVKRTTEKVGIPVSLTRDLEIVLAEPVSVGEGEGAYLKTTARIPVIPANGLGGRLRRTAAELIIDSLVARGQQVSPRAYNTLTAGSPDASLLRAEASMEQVIAGKQHPYFGLFGGSSYALSSDLVIHEGYPLSAMTAHLLSLPAMVNVPEVRDIDMTQVIPLVKKDDVKDVKDPARLTSAVGVDAVSDYIGGVMERREEKNARKKSDEQDQGKKTELATIAALQVATPGLSFALRFDAVVRSDAHLGLLLLALHRFCDPAFNGQIGGKGAKGFGRFTVAQARIFEFENGVRSQDGINLWASDAAGGYAFTDHPMLERVLGAGNDFVDSVDAAELEKFASADANKQFKAR